MKKGWTEYTVDDVAKVINGYAFKSKDFISSGVPIVKIKSLKDKMLVIDNGDFVDEEFLKLNEKYHIKYDDFVIAMTGSHITLPSSAVGRVAKSRHNKTLLLNQRVGKFKVKDEICDHNFLYYFLTTDYFFQNVGLRAKGAGNQANISNSDIGSIKVSLPQLSIQQKIANILSAYDDLIENNTKRVELLEEQAQLIYEEWFVRMKFPNHENTKIDAETGLPEEWSKKYLTDVLNFKTGKLDSNAHVEDGIYDFYTCSKEVYKTNTFCFDGEAVLLGGNNATGNFSLFYVNDKFDAYQRTYIIIAQNQSLPLSYVFFYIEKLLPYFQNVSSGASTKFLTMKIFDKTKILIPDSSILAKYDALVKPCFDSIILYKKQNQLLKEARDILLPRLMMGIIEV